jgi:hypothetical protein
MEKMIRPVYGCRGGGFGIIYFMILNVSLTFFNILGMIMVWTSLAWNRVHSLFKQISMVLFLYLVAPHPSLLHDRIIPTLSRHTKSTNTNNKFTLYWNCVMEETCILGHPIRKKKRPKSWVNYYRPSSTW